MGPSVDRRSVSWQVLFIYVALPIIFGVCGFLMRDLYAEVKTVRETKLDKTEFYQAVGQMDRKTDLIIQLLRDHESNAARRINRQ
jgi:hypothetical protein